jgi:hypothetical protein
MLLFEDCEICIEERKARAPERLFVSKNRILRKNEYTEPKYN